MTYTSRFFFAVTLKVLVCLFITVAGFYLVILADFLTGGDIYFAAMKLKATQIPDKEIFRNIFIDHWD